MTEIRELKLKCKKCHSPLEIDISARIPEDHTVCGFIYCQDILCGNTGYNGVVNEDQLVDNARPTTET